MIREDIENEFEVNHGRFFVIPYDILQKVFNIKEKDEHDVLRKIIEAGGDMINVEVGEMSNRKIKLVKRWKVDQNGDNEAVIELRPTETSCHRFLMHHEMTCEEYINSRRKQENKFTISKLMEWKEEYRQLVKS